MIVVSQLELPRRYHNEVDLLIVQKNICQRHRHKLKSKFELVREVVSDAAQIFDYIIVRIVFTHNIHESSAVVQILLSFQWRFCSQLTFTKVSSLSSFCKASIILNKFTCTPSTTVSNPRCHASTVLFVRGSPDDVRS